MLGVGHSSGRGETQVVFRLLDPLLQELLPLVARFRELAEGDAARLLANRNDILLPNLQSQIRVLQRLEVALRNLESSHRSGLILLAQYVSLPLTAIFHIEVVDEATTPSSTAATSSLPDDESEELLRRSQIRKSELQRLYMSSANCIQAYAEQLVTSPQVTTDDDDDSILPLAQPNPKYTLQFLVALVATFPSSSSKLGHVDDQSGLDDGSASRATVLAAILSVLTICPSSDLIGYRNGGLIFRLVEASTICLAGKAVSTSSRLFLASIQVLRKLLEIAKSERRHWRAMFPGIFVPLYKRILSYRHETPTSEIREIQVQCVGAVANLVRVTMKEVSTHSPSNASDDTTPSAIDLLKQLELTSKQQSNTVLATDPTKSKQVTPSMEFLERARNSATGPLSVLLRTACSSTNHPELNQQGCGLCRVILLETSRVWSQTSITETAFECCLFFRTHESDVIKREAETILEEYQDQLEEDETGRFKDKVHELVKQLPILALGSKHMELKIHFKTLTGYLQMVGPKLELLASLFPLDELAQTMEVNLATPLHTPLISSIGQIRRPPYTYLRPENVELADIMLLEIGRSLGVKQGSFAIDSLISKFCSRMLTTEDYWLLQEESGNLVVAERMLVGVFGHDMREPTSKKLRRQRKTLNTLVSSLLPLLINSCTPPPDSKGVEGAKQSNARRTISILLLRVISTLIKLLGKDIGGHLAALLYPLIQMASDSRAFNPRDEALTTLHVLAQACGSESLELFIYKESNHILSSIVSYLRLSVDIEPSTNLDVDDTFRIASSLTWTLDILVKSSFSKSPTNPMIVSSLHDITMRLMDHFDQYLLEKQVNEEHTLLIIRVYDSILQCLKSFSELMSRSQPTDDGRDAGIQWLELLESVQQPPKGFSPADFQKQNEKEEEGNHKAIYNEDMIFGKSEVGLITQIIFRTAYLLSYTSLFVQMKACDTLSLAFEILASVSSNDQTGTEDENTGIRNAVLRQLATSWPALRARLKNTSEAAAPTNGIANLMILSQSKPISDDTHLFFLGRLLRLVAAMCESSEDFLADRFRTTVWPIMVKHFGLLLGKRKTVKQPTGSKFILEGAGSLEAKNPYEQNLSVSAWTEAEQTLIISMTMSLSRVFNSRCDFNDSVRSCAKDVIMSIVALDRDVLLRKLLELSGIGLPRNPFRTTPGLDHQSGVIQLRESRAYDSLASTCSQILISMRAIPEQAI